MDAQALLIRLLQEVVGVADAMKIMGDLPNQTKGQREIWNAAWAQIMQAVEGVIPDWDARLKAAQEAAAVDQLQKGAPRQ